MLILLLCLLTLLPSCIESPTNTGVEPTGKADSVWTRTISGTQWVTIDRNGTSLFVTSQDPRTGQRRAIQLDAGTGLVVDDPSRDTVESASISPDGQYIACSKKDVVTIYRRTDNTVVTSHQFKIDLGTYMPTYFAWNNTSAKLWMIVQNVNMSGLYELPNVENSTAVQRQTLNEIDDRSAYHTFSALPASDKMMIHPYLIFDAQADRQYRGTYYDGVYPMADGNGWYTVTHAEIQFRGLNSTIKNTLPLFSKFVDGYNDYLMVTASITGRYVAVIASVSAQDPDKQIRVIDTRTAEHVCHIAINVERTYPRALIFDPLDDRSFYVFVGDKITKWRF